ncbi:MAG: type II toxin-antitoxin system VapC family toxin, partial [Mailhella sp.]|nr:type II toxin-antitoxin system VapC family toxin [Mailhella sp.]
FLLDTNVISELRRGLRAHPSVLDWVRRTPNDTMYVSVISMFEIRLGILRVSRKDARQGELLGRWFESQVLPAYRGRILDVNLEVAERCAALHIPDPRPERNAMIAATALTCGFTVVTRNTKDFEATGVPLFNPWL